MIHELEELFKRQARAWPQLAKGIEGLARAKTRPIRIDWFDVFIRHIPHRVGSTTAAVCCGAEYLGSVPSSLDGSRRLVGGLSCCRR